MPALPTRAAREIGPYTLFETVSERAFSATFRAEHRALHRRVLVRAIKPTITAESPFSIEIDREATVLARLDHEAIPRLLDFARTKESVYLVLEDARGAKLPGIVAAVRELASRGDQEPRDAEAEGAREPEAGHEGSGTGMPPDQAAALVLSIARGLGHAHERGVVHRGLDASVIEIAPGGRVLIADFRTADAPGLEDLAKLPPAPEPIEPGEHAGGQPTATPAPEQVLDEAVGPRADVWAAGALFHELLAGAGPFDGEDPRLVAQRLRTAAPAPLPEGTPRSYAQIVARCLSRAPEDRFDGGASLAAALEEALADRTALPVRVLVSRLLAASRQGEAIEPPLHPSRYERKSGSRGPDVARAARSLGAVFAFVALGGGAIQALKDEVAAVPGGAGVSEPAGGVPGKDRGLVRVVAHPWADVYVDGELFDVTPIGRPIPVVPGRHFLTFRHPQAMDEQRPIRVAPGQTVFLDVTMHIEHPDAGAKPAPSVDRSISP